MISFINAFIVACSREFPSEPVDSKIEIALDFMIDARDNQIYKIVTIGSQTWMAENLNYAYTDVSFYNGVFSSDSTSWCYYNKESNCDAYGRLYTWSAVMDSAGFISEKNGTLACGLGKKCKPNKPHRGVCPDGWHVPTQLEFDVLYKVIGGENMAGLKLKSTSGWEGENGIDAVSFGILPAGFRYNGGAYMYMNERSAFWSASEYGLGEAYVQVFSYGEAVYPQRFSKLGCASLRCIRD